ncbi:hypothetical protein [Amycolatopsis regifaucium]|uniref:Glycine zipper domain-containing protein n=1 Tax=Amycolatopsis regifaucium TaxID=546365 RepID=A0A154MVU3_9PSEU|nr:hypothetical protein [Amycolatopsis regifaucium]KZB88385.1 hypothetical protein AVL48_20820 [Amycolatopsis regifaucium]OKA11496.1 hypothetical protein ATP06_0201215 [Amycolatopsis regifaucium]SFH40225.1 hypothetical protein SAMN04489731_10414 [Amycolatopsis regifaucium]
MNNSIELRRAVLYSVSGGLLTIGFGVLAASAAQAAPEPGGTPAQQQAEKVQMNKHRAANVKSTQPAPQKEDKKQVDKGREANKHPGRTRQEQKENRYAPPTGGGKHKEKEAEAKRIERDAVDRARKNPMEDQGDRKLKAINDRDSDRERGNDEVRKSGKGNVYLKTREDDGEKKTAAPGLKALETGIQIDRDAKTAREESTRLAKDRDKGATGSVRAWETTARLADEADHEATRLEKLQGPRNNYITPPEKKRPVVRRGYQPLPKPTRGLRAIEVGAQIEAAVEPAKDEEKALRKLRDQQPEGSDERATFDELVKNAKRNVAWLEYVDDAGKPVTQKIADSIGEDLTNPIKMGAALLDTGVGVGLDKQVENANRKFETASAQARTAARDLTDFRRSVRAPDGTIPPEHRAELDRKRQALRTVTTDATDLFREQQRTLKAAKATGHLMSGLATGVGIGYDVFEDDKPLDEVAWGTGGGVVLGVVGGRFGGAPGGFAGGIAGSAIAEETYKAIRDSGKDINDIVNEADD